MRASLQDKKRLLSHSNRVFPSVSDAVTSRTERGLSLPAARVLVERNLPDWPGGGMWTTDPRLRGASAVKLSDAHIRAVLGRLDMPTLLLLAGARVGDLLDYVRPYIVQLTTDTIEGGHHFHMEANVVKVAQIVKNFLSSANESDLT
mgnify:CR=1 FL=1